MTGMVAPVPWSLAQRLEVAGGQAAGLEGTLASSAPSHRENEFYSLGGLVPH